MLCKRCKDTGRRKEGYDWVECQCMAGTILVGREVHPRTPIFAEHWQNMGQEYLQYIMDAWREYEPKQLQFN